MGEAWIIKDETQLLALADHIRTQLAGGSFVHVKLNDEARTPDQNALLHATLRDVAKQKGDESVDELKRYVKLHFGIPIRREEDEEFKHWYDAKVRSIYSYEQKLALMDVIDVTSDMNKEQFTRLIDNVIHHYADQGYTVQV